MRHCKRRIWTACTALTVGLLLAALIWPDASNDLPPPRADELKHAVGSPAVAMESCGECHAAVYESFQNVPHFRTLHRGTDPEVADRFDGETVQLAGLTFTYELLDGMLHVKADSVPYALPVHWVFGSGHHAQTPVSIPPESYSRAGLLEHHVSWYHGFGLDWTIGHHGIHGIGLDSLGDWNSHDVALRCFGCHTTRLPLNANGRIDFDRIVTGVRCQRCHENADEHFHSIQGAKPGAPMVRWSRLSPAESVSRCGECHRSTTDFKPEDLRPDNPDLLRFAPVGLSQSPCFQKQDLVKVAHGSPARLDCTTCHDPHAPAASDSAVYLRSCLQCHGSQPHQAPVCATESMTSQCLECHMPKVPFDRHVEFTDHWIRVREH